MEERVSTWWFTGDLMDGSLPTAQMRVWRGDDARVKKEVRSEHLEEMRLHGRIRNSRSGTGMASCQERAAQDLEGVHARARDKCCRDVVPATQERMVVHTCLP
jgi:hypothetical protein